jgi:phosphopantothenoylcysteine synthetase/decarboxylase
MDQEELVKRVTSEVLRQLQQRTVTECVQFNESTIHALAIFTGGTIGFTEGLEEIEKLQSHGFDITVVLSPTAEKIVGIDAIQAKLGKQIEIITSQSGYPKQLLQQAQLILVPVLTQNTAAKLAFTIADTQVTTLIMQALMMGKPVIAAVNAAEPEASERIQIQMGKASIGLLRTLRSNLEQLKSHGMRLVDVASLAEESQKIIEGAMRPSSVKMKKSVLDATTVKNAATQKDKTIIVSLTTLVTPLAYDVAREFGIEIIKK